MASDSENLQAAKSAAIARLLEVLSKKKPSYSIDGQKVEWTAYANMLRAQIQELDALIQAAEGPYQIDTYDI